MTNLTRDQMRVYQQARRARIKAEAVGVAPPQVRPLPKDHPLAARVERARVKAQRDYERPDGRGATAAEVIAADERAAARVMAKAPMPPAAYKPPVPYKPPVIAPVAYKSPLAYKSPAAHNPRIKSGERAFRSPIQPGVLAVGGMAGKGRAVAGYDPNRAPHGAVAVEISLNMARTAGAKLALAKAEAARSEALKELAAQSKAQEAERKARAGRFVDAGLKTLRLVFGTV